MASLIWSIHQALLQIYHNMYMILNVDGHNLLDVIYDTHHTVQGLFVPKIPTTVPNIQIIWKYTPVFKYIIIIIVTRWRH